MPLGVHPDREQVASRACAFTTQPFARTLNTKAPDRRPGPGTGVEATGYPTSVDKMYLSSGWDIGIGLLDETGVCSLSHPLPPSDYWRPTCGNWH